MEKVQVRYPVPNKKDLESGLKKHAEDLGKSLYEVIHMYIEGRRKDIANNRERVKKAKLRISKAEECIEVATEIMCGYVASLTNNKIRIKEAERKIE